MRFLLLVLLLCGARWAVAQPNELHVALWVAEAKTARPGSDGERQNGGLYQFNAQLAREICRRIKARCVMENVLFGEILPGVEARLFDLGFGNYLRTPEREKRVTFSESIWNSSSRLLGRVANKRRLAARFGPDVALDGLRDVRLGGIAESRQMAYLESIAGARGLTLSKARTMAEAIALLRDGEVDYCLLPMLTAYELLRYETPGIFEFSGPPLLDHGLGGSVHIALAKDSDALRQAVNQAILAMRADGTYHRLLHQNFPFSLE